MHSTTIRRELKKIAANRKLQQHSAEMIALADCPKRTDEERNNDLRIEAEELMREFLNEEI